MLTAIFIMATLTAVSNICTMFMVAALVGNKDDNKK
jgi:hypothetical protein